MPDEQLVFMWNISLQRISSIISRDVLLVGIDNETYKQICFSEPYSGETETTHKLLILTKKGEIFQHTPVSSQPSLTKLDVGKDIIDWCASSVNHFLAVSKEGSVFSWVRQIHNFVYSSTFSTFYLFTGFW